MREQLPRSGRLRHWCQEVHVEMEKRPSKALGAGQLLGVSGFLDSRPHRWHARRQGEVLSSRRTRKPDSCSLGSIPED